jgi:hypothetical protein
MSYLRMIPAALIASVLFFHFPSILGVVQPNNTPIAPPTPAGPTPPAALKDLYVSENLDGGAKLQLSNGEIYEIYPDDRDIAAGWLLPSNIKITTSKDPNYPVMITNTVTNTSIKAKKFDPSAPPSNSTSKMPPPSMPKSPTKPKPAP